VGDARRISCVVPAYNAGKYIEEAIESIKAQTRQVHEIIVVDDVSTDDTCEKVERIPGVRLLRMTSNAGAGAARNRGAEAATGELLAFLDADDLWVPTKLDVQLEAWREHPEWSATVTMMENFWIDELRDEAERFVGHRLTSPVPAYTGSTLVAAREAFFAVGGLNVNMRHGDVLDWVLRARNRGLETGLVREVLSRRRIHATNTSRERAAAINSEFLGLLKRKLDFERRTS
jgi:glycosyltransferase involved in cell wall biosynthesis